MRECMYVFAIDAYALTRFSERVKTHKYAPPTKDSSTSLSCFRQKYTEDEESACVCSLERSSINNGALKYIFFVRK